MYQKTHGINPRDSVMIAFSQFQSINVLRAMRLFDDCIYNYPTFFNLNCNLNDNRVSAANQLV